MRALNVALIWAGPETIDGNRAFAAHCANDSNAQEADIVQKRGRPIPAIGWRISLLRRGASSLPFATGTDTKTYRGVKGMRGGAVSHISFTSSGVRP